MVKQSENESSKFREGTIVEDKYCIGSIGDAVYSVGMEVYFLGSCYQSSDIFKTEIAEILEIDHWGRQKMKLKGIDRVVVSSEIANDEQEAFNEAALIRDGRIRSLESELSLLKRRTFYVKEIK